jgi:hypothetical protein
MVAFSTRVVRIHIARQTHGFFDQSRVASDR